MNKEKYLRWINKIMAESDEYDKMIVIINEVMLSLDDLNDLELEKVVSKYIRKCFDIHSYNSRCELFTFFVKRRDNKICELEPYIKSVFNTEEVEYKISRERINETSR